MRILYLTHQYFPRHVGGTEVYLRGLVRRMRQAGHEVLIVTGSESAAPEAEPRVVEASHEGVPVFEVSLNLSVTPHPARFEYDHPLAGAAVARLLRSFNPDVAHALHTMKLSSSALQACHDAGVPVLATLTDYWHLCPRVTLVDVRGRQCDGPGSLGKCAPCTQQLHGYPEGPCSAVGPARYLSDLAALAQRLAWLRRRLLACSRLVALSDEMRRAFVENGYPPSRIEVMPHGLEADDLLSAPPRAIGPRPLRRLGLVGTVAHHKGPHVVLEALRLLPDVDLECRVHGPLRDDAYCERIRLLAHRDRRIRLLGEFEPDQTGRVLGELDLLAVPALWRENEPLLAKAALHLGVPVLATPNGSVGTLARRAGALLTRGDHPEDWAEALRPLASAGVPEAAPFPCKTMDDNAAEWMALYRQEARKRCVLRSA